MEEDVYSDDEIFSGQETNDAVTTTTAAAAAAAAAADDDDFRKTADEEILNGVDTNNVDEIIQKALFGVSLGKLLEKLH
jgi:hypothetical protein